MSSDPQPLLISVEEIPSGRMPILRGEGDMVRATRLRDAVLRHLSAARSLWLDLAGVTFMDSSGIHILTDSQRRASLLGHPLVIARASPAVERLFQVTGTSTLFARPVGGVPSGTTVGSVDRAMKPTGGHP